eukprot:scaffold149_cov315-Pinguiococcus_pyrenoidosus.AAC.29
MHDLLNLLITSCVLLPLASAQVRTWLGASNKGSSKPQAVSGGLEEPGFQRRGRLDHEPLSAAGLHFRAEVLQVGLPLGLQGLDERLAGVASLLPQGQQRSHAEHGHGVREDPCAHAREGAVDDLLREALGAQKALQEALGDGALDHRPDEGKVLSKPAEARNRVAYHPPMHTLDERVHRFLAALQGGHLLRQRLENLIASVQQAGVGEHVHHRLADCVGQHEQQRHHGGLQVVAKPKEHAVEGVFEMLVVAPLDGTDQADVQTLPRLHGNLDDARRTPRIGDHAGGLGAEQNLSLGDHMDVHADRERLQEVVLRRQRQAELHRLAGVVQQIADVDVVEAEVIGAPRLLLQSNFVDAPWGQLRPRKCGILDAVDVFAAFAAKHIAGDEMKLLVRLGHQCLHAPLLEVIQQRRPQSFRLARRLLSVDFLALLDLWLFGLALQKHTGGARAAHAHHQCGSGSHPAREAQCGARASKVVDPCKVHV